MATAAGSQVVGDVGGLVISTQLYLRVLMAWLETVDLLSLCTDLGSVNGSGSLSHKVPVWDPTNLEAAALSEGTAATLGDPTDSSFTITVAKQVAGVGQSDELWAIAPQDYGFAQFESKLVERASMQATDLVCTAGAAFTGGSVGGAVAMTVDLAYDAYFTYDALKPPDGQGFLALSDKQYRELFSSMRGEGNGMVLYQNPEHPIARALNLMQGYKGTLLNGLHVLNTNRVTTSGGQYKGFVFGRDSLYYKWADVTGLGAYATGPAMARQLQSEMGRVWRALQSEGLIDAAMSPPPITVLLEYDRKPGTGETILYIRLMIGVSADPAKGVLVSTST